MSRFASFDDACAAIWDRSGWDRGFISNPFAGDDAARLGLIRTRLVLELLGNLDAAVPLIHIAGSKGKGSTTVMTDAIFRASGLRSGRFTSPHLHTIRERFAIDDENIGEDDFALIASEVIDAAKTVEARESQVGELTAWEISTVMALLWFARSNCDVAVIEVGLGGTLDATNVITPIVSVITRLDFEHTAILGNTMPEIASNKAGIIKPGIPVVTVDQPTDGLAVIAQTAESLAAPLLVAGRDWAIEGDELQFRSTGPWWDHGGLTLSLPGAHQLENAGLAIAAAEVVRRTGRLSFDVSSDEVRQGLRDAVLPGRFEVVERESGQVVVLDGAHTPASMAALARTVQSRFDDRPITLIIGMLAGRDPAEVLPAISEIATTIILTTSGNPRSLPPPELIRALGDSIVPIGTAANVHEALATVANRPNTVVVVSGSFGVVADARISLGLTDSLGDTTTRTI